MEKNDFRARRTQLMIQEAYWSLLEENKTGIITVRDICERLHCSRKTFYTYYETKDVLHIELVRNTIGCMNADFLLGLIVKDDTSDTHSKIIKVFYNIKKHSQEFKIFFARNDAVFLDELSTFFKSPITVFHQKKLCDPVDELKREVISSICILILKYFVFHPECTPEQISSMFYEFMSKELLNWLQIPKQYIHD